MTLKQYLTDHKIKFVDIDVSANEQERDEMIKKSGQIGVPVLEIDSQIIVGFDKEQIDKALRITKIKNKT